jgi:Tfp pilus assembly protein PilN
MIEINLVPEEYKKRKKKKVLVLPKGLVFFISLWIFGLFIMLGLLLNMSVESKRARVEKLEKEWSILQPKKIQLETLKSETAALEGELNTLKKVLYKKFLWSEKLNSLSDNVSDGMWFTNLSIGAIEEAFGTVSPELPKNAIRSVIIEGRIYSTTSGEVDSINRLIKNLKGDKDFFKDFKDIELKSVEAKKIADKDVKDFIIVLSLKEEDVI